MVGPGRQKHQPELGIETLVIRRKGEEGNRRINVLTGRPPWLIPVLLLFGRNLVRNAV
jgi:hypothetical protein